METNSSRSNGLVRLLICAMGGEGGGVLTGWIVEAARAQGLAVQATSVPGVAQRTGGTTYYIEMAPRDPAGRAPVFALTPVPGQIDIVLASELAEGARAARQGFATPDRTELVASTHRVFLIQEKMAMGDGRLDAEGLKAAARVRSRRATFLDMEKIATDAGVPISPVMLGSLAAATSLPIERRNFEQAVRDGRIAVEKNLAAFDAAYRAALDAARPQTPSTDASASTVSALKPADFVMPPPAPVRPEAGLFPEAARETIARGLDRLADYQDEAYAKLYLDRLEPFVSADADVVRELARHLALRMSYEDVFRVAQHKARSERFQRIRAEVSAKADEPVEVQDFFKPGVREIADGLPPRLAKWLLRRADKSPRLARFHIGMKVRTTTLSGYLRVWLLAKLRTRRRGTYRYAIEQAETESWLALVQRALAAGGRELALEVIELAGLIKGYGDTHARGLASYRRIVDTLVVPAIEAPSDAAAGRIRSAREAALADPEGRSLSAALGAVPATA